MISGVILAAGKSTRLGRPKQLLELGGESILLHTVRNAMNSHLDQVVLVLGDSAFEIADAVGEQGQSLAINPDYELGQSTSLKLGLSTIDPEAEAVLFLLGDQPQVSAEIINAVISHFRKTGGIIVMPSYHGIRSNPVLFSRELFPEIAKVTGDQGARSVVRTHFSEVHAVEIDADPPLDVDTEEDYEKLRKLWRPVTSD
jgi:molybdenum cofactor cytidylyltransferase